MHCDASRAESCPSDGSQCEAEIARLKGIQAAAMRRKAAERLADLRAACEATRLTMPRLPEDAEDTIAAQGIDMDGKVGISTQNLRPSNSGEP